MKKIEIDVYNIDELKTINKSAYDKVMERVKDYLIENNFNFASENALCILKDKYNLDILEKNIFYSISYCQGDGFCFIDNNILSYIRIKNKSDNMNIFEKWIINNLSKDEISLLLDYLNCNYNLYIKKTSHSYCHPYTCKIDCEYFYSTDDDNYADRMNNFIDDLCKKLFDNVYIEICSDIEKALYDCYDVSNSDVIEFINANDYYYDINGVMY